MSERWKKERNQSRLHFSIDTLAVTLAFVLALAVRVGLLKNVPW